MMEDIYGQHRHHNLFLKSILKNCLGNSIQILHVDVAGYTYIEVTLNN